jgi:Zn-dependent protease
VSEQPTPAPAPAWLPPAPQPVPPPVPRNEPSAPRKRGLGGGLLLAGALVVKFGAKLKALLLLLPKLKLFTTSASMLVSIAAYSLIWGWTFALGFVLLLLVHEMGHVIQLRREGVEASAPLFIPFLGAVVGVKSLGGNALAEARVGLAGPVLGSLGAAALVPVALATDNDFWFALAFTGFFLNLFNLLPVVPLDGGRAFAAMAPWMWFVGLSAVVVLCFVAPNPILLLIALFAALETWRRWRERREGDETTRAYYAVRPVHRLAVGGVYLALVALLVVGMDLTFVERSLGDA